MFYSCKIVPQGDTDKNNEYQYKMTVKRLNITTKHMDLYMQLYYIKMLMS